MTDKVFELDVNESGDIHFQANIPELRGKKVKLVLLSEEESELPSSDLERTVDYDWSEWADSREDIYEEYREYRAKE